MSSTPNNGGPAFPMASEPDNFGYFDKDSAEFKRQAMCGMTLRDYFAAMASDHDVELFVQAENSRRYQETGNGEHGYPQYTLCTREEARYMHADAMLEAREQ